MRALVLSGGAARGSYEFGVWKALRELKIEFEIVTGTSIGATNGALIVQDDFQLANELWNTLSTKDIFYFDYDLHSKEGQAKFCMALAKALIKKGGLELERMENLLKTYIDENKIRESKMDFGLVTYSYTDKKPVMLTKNDIPKGSLVDYIIASATCFPIVQPKEIDNKKYLDGGFYDSMPINLAIDMGADEIIAVDLRAVGIKKQTKDKRVKVKVIAPSTSIGPFLSFTPNDAKFRISLGYNDTMKAYNKLDGIIYSFEKNELVKNFLKLKKVYKNVFNEALLNTKAKKIMGVTIYNNIFNNLNNDEGLFKIINKSIDELGRIYKINVTRIYKIKDFNNIIINNVVNNNISKRNFSDKIIVDNLYNLIFDKDSKKIVQSALVSSKEFSLCLYLFSVYAKSGFFKRYKIRKSLKNKVELA